MSIIECQPYLHDAFIAGLMLGAALGVVLGYVIRIVK